MIFNNGNEYAGSQRNYSTIDEIALPPFRDNAYPREPDGTFAPARPQWTYTAPNPADFYARTLSGAQRLPNGNTQICDGTNGTIFQVAQNGTTVWRYDTSRYNASVQIYRAPWYPPDYPGLKYLDLTPKSPISLGAGG